MSEEQDASKFQIFRASEGTPLMEANCMDVVPFTDVQTAGLKAMHEAGMGSGDQTTVLFSIPGFSLVHAWFKKDYPLPLHSHEGDCLYYIVAGSLKLGTEWLGPRDGFFLPSGTPYAYTPGPDGVEVLEIRQVQKFDFKLLAKGEAFWKRAAETVAARQADWATAKPPALNA